MWDLKQQAKMSGLGVLGGSAPSTEDSTTKTIDATSDNGIMQMQSRGLPIKLIPTME